MYHSDVTIKEGAFIVSDAHYSISLRPELLEFLKEVETNKLLPTQLILMGDIFDALFGGVSFTQNVNHEIISTINKISKKIEVIYLEGNHDFNLKNIFKKAKVFPLSKQPLLCTYKNKKIVLAHGDFDGGTAYTVFTFLIRNPIVLYILQIIDTVTSHAILKKLDIHLSKKNDCKELQNFRQIVAKRLESHYDCDYFIEGHFHQNKQFVYKSFTYVNLGVFACNQRYFIVNSSEDKELLEERIF